ncbi:YceI family protein [Pleionea sediminis]|uniref:YceI family protein n=1 Tax=Pleionea sediminis TaxID=2569479 RepID=UPI001186DBDA|nr:YceI family protein [Pleionea sediminis]
MQSVKLITGARLFCASLLLSCLTGCSYLLTPSVEVKLEELESGQYKLDPAHTTVLFKVSHMGLSTYIGRFNKFDATLDFNPKQIKKTRLDAFVETASVDVNNPKLEDSLKGGTWFDSEKFPRATLKTLSVEPSSQSGSQFIFNAELTLLGVTKPIQLQASFNGGADNILTGYYTLGFSATGTIKRSDFGMDSYIPMVGDTINIEIYAEFQQQ